MGMIGCLLAASNVVVERSVMGYLVSSACLQWLPAAYRFLAARTPVSRTTQRLVLRDHNRH